METEVPEENHEDTTIHSSDWDSRILCSDGSCIGIIGPDGLCKECGRKYEGELPEMSGSEEDEDPPQKPNCPMTLLLTLRPLLTMMNGEIGFCAATATVSASSEPTANAKNAENLWNEELSSASLRNWNDGTME